MTDQSINVSVVLNKQVREQVDQLCANLYLNGHGTGPKILAVTSADAGEGRSSLALALAMQIPATLGATALVIEGNLRSPGLGELVELPRNVPGFVDLITQQVEPEKAIYKMDGILPDILPAGKAESDMIVKIMTRPRLEPLLQMLSRKYDYLVMETPPINLYPEAHLLISLSDGVIMTIRSGITSRETVSMAARKVEAMNGKFLGLVLNQRQYHLPKWLYRRL